jgi:hypothetical protein
MAVRYGVPVSEFLARHSSAELTELMAYFSLQSQQAQAQHKPSPKFNPNPEEQTRLIKQSLFKGGK